MPTQPRVAKVLAMLLVSMTTGAIVLMALGHNPPSAGPFSLWTYYCLTPVNNAISSQAAQAPGRWDRIEIYYSGTRSGSIEPASPGSSALNFHFCLCNGSGGTDGQIQTTEKWQKQQPATPTRTWHGTNKTILICIIGNAKTIPPTDCQVKRLQMLVEELCKKFDIQPESVYYPSDWR